MDENMIVNLPFRKWQVDTNNPFRKIERTPIKPITNLPLQSLHSPQKLPQKSPMKMPLKVLDANDAANASSVVNRQQTLYQLPLEGLPDMRLPKHLHQDLLAFVILKDDRISLDTSQILKRFTESVESAVGDMYIKMAAIELDLFDEVGPDWLQLTISAKILAANMLVWLHQYKTLQTMDYSLPSVASSTPDPSKLAKAIRQELKSEEIDIVEFTAKVLEDVIPHSYLDDMLCWPLPRNWLHPRATFVYSKVWEWMKLPLIERLELFSGYDKRDVNESLDTKDIGRRALGFLRENNVSVTEFSKKVVGFSRPHVSMFLNQPIPWSKCKDYQRQVYKDIRLWLEKSANERLAKFNRLVVVKKRQDKKSNCLRNSQRNKRKWKAYNSGDWIMEDDENYANIGRQSAYKGRMTAESLEKIKEIVKRVGCDLPEFVDTKIVSSRFFEELKKGNVTVLGFSTAINVNRNYLSNLIKTPVNWESCSKMQRYVYACFSEFFGKNPIYRKHDKSQAFHAKLVARVEALERLKQLFSKTHDQVQKLDPFDTTEVCDQVICLVRSGATTNVGLGHVFGIDRHVISAMMKNPVPWDKMNYSQQIIFTCLKSWIAEMPPIQVENVPNTDEASMIERTPKEDLKAKKRKTPSSTTPKDLSKRVKLTDEQIEYLKSKFEANPKPTNEAKQEMCQELDLSMRCVTIFFNHRRFRQMKDAETKPE